MPEACACHLVQLRKAGCQSEGTFGRRLGASRRSISARAACCSSRVTGTDQGASGTDITTEARMGDCRKGPAHPATSKSIRAGS